MTVAVRAATAADHARIVAWNIALAAESEDKPLDPGIVSPGVERVLADPSLGRYFIAERDGVPVGQLMLTFEWSDWRNGMFWWIQSVYVESSHRGSGVFRALYRHVEALGRADGGVCGLRLYVHDGNDAASEVYRRLGMQDGQYRVLESLFPS